MTLRLTVLLSQAVSRPLARRLQVSKFSFAPACSMSSIPHAQGDVAIIGGGVAGLSCALQLASKGVSTTIFDMGIREAGGRCCSRQMEQLAFDHGCQLIPPPKSPTFQAAVEAWVDAGAAQQWSGRFGTLDGAASTFQPWAAASPTAAGALGSTTQSVSKAAEEQSSLGFFGSLETGPFYTGVPSMQSICAHMVKQLEGSGNARLVLSCKVQGVSWDEQQRLWQLHGSYRGRAAAAMAAEGGQQQEAALGSFKALVMADSLVAIPDSAGYAGLCEPNSAVAGVAQQVSAVASDPVFALMVAFDQPVQGLPFDAASVRGSAFQWVACNSSKPGRPHGGAQCWVAITTPAFARQLMQQFPLHIQGRYNPQTRDYLQSVAPVLYSEFEQLVAPLAGCTSAQAMLPKPAYCHAQRWGRAFVQQPLGMPCLTAPQQHFAACGDFCLGSSVEGAWLSGQAAAEQVAASLQ